jgi:group I intron endonuclease
MGYIYIIENQINGKKYIGQTIQKDIKNRWYSHKNLKHKTVGKILFNAYNKYDFDNFKYKIICICFDEDTNKYEEEYIAKYNTIYPNGYNLLPGGNNKKHNEYTKKILSEKMMGEKNPNFGKKRTPEQLKLMSEKMKGSNNTSYGKKFTIEEKQKRLDRYIQNPEIKDKISNSLKDYHKNKNVINNINSKRVEQYDLNGNLINMFNSISEASRQINISHSVISRACNKENYTAGSFKWKKF